jgi:hypothetical protein
VGTQTKAKGIHSVNISPYTIFPNPTKDEIVIEQSDFKNEIQATLYSIDGKTVLYEVLSQEQNKMKLQDLNTGIYYLKLNCKDNETIHKIIKE